MCIYTYKIHVGLGCVCQGGIEDPPFFKQAVPLHFDGYCTVRMA